MLRPLLLIFLLNGITLNAQLYFTTGAGFTVDYSYNTMSYVEVREDGTYFSGHTGQTLSGTWSSSVDATGLFSSLYLYGSTTTAPNSLFALTLYDSSFSAASLSGSWADLASGYAALSGNPNNINLSDIIAIDITFGESLGYEAIDGMISRLGGGLSEGAPYPPSIDLEDEYLLIQNKLFTLDVADSITSDSSDTLSYQWFHPSGNSYPDDLGGNSSTLNLYGAASNSGAWTLEVSDEWGSSTHTLNLIYKQDSDGDGFYDEIDAFPNDPAETTDTDGDGVGDNADAFPNDPAETTDADGDGIGDNADAFPNDPTETTDTDGDGVGDNADAFPNDPTETTDTDGDGVGDNADAFPNDPAETRDTDGDGVGDNADAFPNDPAETRDTDGDGVGDNADAYSNYNDSVISNFISDYISSNNYLRLNEVRDLRPGSTMIEVSGNQATVQLQMEESSDLQTWEDTGTPATMTLPADTDTKFFRFKMAE